MKSSQRIKDYLYLILTLLFLSNTTQVFQNSIWSKESKVPDKGGLLFKHKHKMIMIKYQKNTIIVYMNHVKYIEIPYSLPEGESAFPVNCIIVNNKSPQSYLIFQDSILLLPLNEVNKRINLIGINLVSRKLLTNSLNNDYMLSTSCPWILINNSILMSNQPNPDYPTSIHYFKIKYNSFLLYKNKDVQFTEESFIDDQKCLNFLKSIK